MIKQYVYDKKRNKIGMLIAIKENGEAIISGCKVNRSHGDVFDKDLGMKICEGRLFSGRPVILPKSIRKEVENFADRCKRYFKVDHVELPFFCD